MPPAVPVVCHLNRLSHMLVRLSRLPCHGAAHASSCSACGRLNSSFPRLHLLSFLAEIQTELQGGARGIGTWWHQKQQKLDVEYTSLIRVKASCSFCANLEYREWSFGDGVDGSGDGLKAYTRRITCWILAFPMEFTKKDASAFARLGKRKRAQVRENRRLLEKRSQQLLEQSALLKHDIDTFESELATVGIHDYLTGVAHVCECAPLCPAVWSLLPVQLLQCVFACLPLLDIMRLRVLSKTWDRYVTGVTPGFTKLCAERNPNLFALVCEGCEFDGDNGPIVVRLFDSKGKQWHRFIRETCELETCDTMLAGDGGLLCLVSTVPDKEMEIVVFNPLTMQGRELPPSSSFNRVQPRMVQLVMDRDSKCYKVLVVSKKEHGGDAVARIFSSLTGKWSKPNIFSDLIFGRHYSWKSYGPTKFPGGRYSWKSYGPSYRHVAKEKGGPWAYDCASSTLLELDDGYLCRCGDKSVLVKDHLFVLVCPPYVNHTQKYVLKEYQAQSCQPHWVRVKVHKCFELDQVSGYQGEIMLETQLFGCQDFLLVIAYHEGCEDDEALPKRTLLFDLSTSKWQIISNEIPWWGPDEHVGDMFELRWDAVA